MRLSLLLVLPLVGICTTIAYTRTVPIVYFNDTRTFSVSEVLNPYVIVTFNTLELSNDIGIMTATTLQGGTSVIVAITLMANSYINTNIFLQILLLVKLNSYEVYNDLIINGNQTSVNYTSSNGLIYTGVGAGNMALRWFLNGFSSSTALSSPLTTTSYLN